MIRSRDEMYEAFLRITPDVTPREMIILRKLADAAFHMDADGKHVYYGTYCRHDNHEACKETCKTCASPCVCHCHRENPDGL